MAEHAKPNTFGPFRVIKQLRPSLVGQRWLALRDGEQSSHVLHKIDGLHERSRERRFLEAAGALSDLRHTHVLHVEHYSVTSEHVGILVTPFAGNQDGVVTLADLARGRGEPMPSGEVDRVVGHLLDAAATAHERGIAHGRVVADEILVDPRGSLRIELYGLRRHLEDGAPSRYESRDEVRSIARIGYTLLTGVDATDTVIPPSRLVKRLSPDWDLWFEEALGAAGFDSAREALGSLPSATPLVPEVPRSAAVRTVLRRFRLPLTPG